MGDQIPVETLLRTSGLNNIGLDTAKDRLIKGNTYRELSTACLMPLKAGFVHHRVATALSGLIRPMNQLYAQWYITGMEVGEAYNEGIRQILSHPQLSTWKFLLTMEHDNLPPPDGLVKLLESICNSPFAAVSGLYWTKGEMGQPMIYGNPNQYPVNYRPQVPIPDTVQECRGIGMGFAVWDMNLFKDPRLTPPWFVTKQQWDPMKGVQLGTQDLVFCEKATAIGYRFAVDTRVKVGHMDFATETVW